MTKEEKDYLNDLSIKCYGNSSKWKKMVERPEIVTLTRKKEDGTEESYKTTSYTTVEEVTKIMEEIWKEEEERIAKEALIKAEETFKAHPVTSLAEDPNLEIKND